MYRINRIRLEFKAVSVQRSDRGCGSINRIRLEFKVQCQIQQISAGWVLIESDWNLKIYKPIDANESGMGINRIRLEFKEE